VLEQPLVDRRGFAGGVVVQHEVEFQAAGDGGVDELEEPEELLVAVPAVGLGDDRAAGQVERGEQAGGAVADVVVGHPGRGRGQHWQARGGPVQGLDLRLLVHAQDQGVLRRRHVEADDVAGLADELRVGAQLPGLDEVRLEAEGPPDPRDRRLGQAGLRRHRPGRPVRVLPAALLRQRPRDQHFHLLVGDLPRRPGPRRVTEAVQPALREPDPPLADRLPRQPGPGRDPGQRRDPVLVRAGQHHPGPPGQRLRRRPLTRQSLQRRALSIRQDQRDKLRARHPPSLQPAKSSKTQDTSRPP
jgi:hypothetical protein